MSNVLTFKNRQTGRSQNIVQQDLEKMNWGFRFFVADELEAYRAAYEYRNSKHGYKVEFAGGAQRWMITVFNSIAVSAGIDGAK
jgi:hypothetical protein